MKKYIEYFYDVELQKIINVGDNYFFNINGINYCLYEVKGEINMDRLELIISVLDDSLDTKRKRHIVH